MGKGVMLILLVASLVCLVFAQETGRSCEPLRIAVIGGGPSGLFFTHAVNKIVESQKDSRAVEVTIFERSALPGGQWQSDGASEVSIYDNLWTNGASYLHEFSDYTYDEHFGRPVGVYMRRQDLLEYILGRVTKDRPDFFDKHLVARTEVVNVNYLDMRQEFEVTTKDVNTGTLNLKHFDKCVWAAGQNSVRSFPQKLIDDVREGGFAGRIIHSSDMANFEDDVKGKRILLIGGGYSAEDLALQSIKVGVDEVFIAVRSSDGGDVASMSIWPYDKVDLMAGVVMTGAAGENKVVLHRFDEDDWEADLDGPSIILENIDTIVFCTGYREDTSMLSANLNRNMAVGATKFEVPKDWKMNHALDAVTGEVETNYVSYFTTRVDPDYYYGISAKNPNMMFVTAFHFHTPLLAIELHAHLLAKAAVGILQVPSEEDVKRLSDLEMLRVLSNPTNRHFVDARYWHHYRKLDEDSRWVAEFEGVLHDIETLDTIMRIADYPMRLMSDTGFDVPFSNMTQYYPFAEDGQLPDCLTETGKRFYNMVLEGYFHRDKDEGEMENIVKHKYGLTYRDYVGGDEFVSLHTGKKARKSLEAEWLTL